ncbi:ABC transporter permease [Halostella litorea]|uniref:ABC transporter permease n=1 Tax=Halostella litorea TaxID=2528831 RepID=UPI001091A1AB|nr:ABC transporter permease [Halostella litorea]
MTRLTSLTATLLRDWARNREAVFFALFFPLILLLIFSTVFAGGATEFDLAVQNNDVDGNGTPTALSATFVDALERAGPLDVERVDPDRDLSDADRLEERTGHRRVLVIPEGFHERVRAGSGRVRMAVIRDTIERAGGNVTDEQRTALEGVGANATQGNLSGASPVEVTLLTSPDDDAAGAVGSVLDSVVGRFNDRSIGVEEPPVTVHTEERGPERLGGVDYFLPAFIVATVLINGVMTVPSAVATLKRDGTLKRLAATPLRKHEWVLANVIQQSILAVGVTGVMLAVARVAFGVQVVPGPLSIALVVVGAVAFTALGMVVGGLIRDPGSAISLGGAIAFPLMFVSGIFWELDLMPATLQRVAEYSPVTHYHRSLRQLLILDSTDGVASTFAVLLALAAVFLVGALYATRWQEFD